MGINLGIASKVAIGLTTAGAIAGGSYLTSEYLLGTKVNELLKEDDLILLTKDKDEAQWVKRWKEYLKKSNNKWGLNDYDDKSKNTNVAPETFKEACAYNSSRKVNNRESDIYKEVTEFCTKEFAISELIGKEEGIELITAEQLTDSKWTTIWGKYFDEAKEQNPLELGDLKASQKTVVPANYKTQCDKEKVKEVKNKKDPNYLKVKNWCTANKIT